jgi:hypothetical protein
MPIRRPMILLAAGACALAACDKTAERDESPTAGQPVSNTNAAENIPSVELHDQASAAANASLVKRFPDELRLAPTVNKLIAVPTTVRTMPHGTEAVVVFRDPADVTLTEVAKEQDYYLVVFSDPKERSRTLAGWIYKDAMDVDAAKAAESAPASKCKTGEVYVLADALCAAACTHDGDCTASGGVCDGNGLVSLGSNSSSRAQYCVGG